MRDIIVMLGFLGLVPLSFIRPFVGLICWTWFALMSPHRETFGFAFDFQFNFIIAIITLIGCFFSSEKIRPLWNKGMLWIGAWFGFTIFTLLFALDKSYSYAYFLHTPLKLYIHIAFIILLVNSPIRIITMLWIIALSLGYYSVSLGLVGILEGGKNLGISEQFGPLGTLLQDRNHMALALCMLIPILLYLSKYTRNIFVKRSLWFVLFLTIISILVSYSRGGWICLLFIALYYFWSVRKKWVYFGVTAFFIFVGSFLLSDQWYQRMDFSNISQDESFNGRIESWKVALEIANQNPVTGGGFRAVQNQHIFDQYQYVTKLSHPKAAHSIYFEVLSDHGYVGLIFFLALLAYGIWTNLRTKKYTKNKKELQDMADMFLLCFYVFSIGGGALSMAYFDLFYILLTLSFLFHKFLVKSQKGVHMPSKRAWQR